MLFVHVTVEVKPECVEDFIEATIINAKASRQEPGILRFDVLQDINAPTHFMLVEVYRTKDDTSKHKVTDHYQIWNKTVADMMAAPRSKQIYKGLFTGED